MFFLKCRQYIIESFYKKYILLIKRAEILRWKKKPHHPFEEWDTRGIISN